MQIFAPVQKPQGAIAGIGEAFGVGMRAAQYMARLLRLDDTGLWPKIGSGRTALIGVPDMVNLTIALACCADRPGEGPRVAREFRSLRAVSGFRRQDDGSRTELPINLDVFPSLAEWADAWVDGLIRLSDGQGSAVHPNDDARLQRPTIRLVMTTPIHAVLTLPAADGRAGFDHIEFEVPGTTAQRASKLHQAEVTFGLPELEALAEIARAAYAPPGGLLTPSTSSPGRDEVSATPETTKATGTGIHDGLQVGQPALATQNAPVNKAHSATGKGSKQLLLKPAASRSQERHHPAPERKRRHGTHRTDTATP